MPGYYMRHRNGEVWADLSDGTTLFKADASFKPEAGLAALTDKSMVSYKASNIAGNYIRHQNGLLYLTTISTDGDKADATFKQFKQ